MNNNELPSEYKDFLKQNIRGGAAYGFWNIVTKILSTVNVFLILKYLTVYQYGVYKLSVSVFVVFSGILLAGLNGIVFNDASEYLGRGKRPEAKRLLYEFFILKVILGLGTWAILFFGSELIAAHYSAGVGHYIKILSFLYLINPILNVFDIFFTSMLKFFVSAIIPFIMEVSKFLLLVYSIFITGLIDIERVLWISVFAPLVALLYVLITFFIKFKDKIVIPATDKYILLKVIKAHGKWALAKSYFRTMPENIRLWLIKIFISTEAVAIYSVAESIFLTAQGLLPTQVFAGTIPRQVGNIDHLATIFRRGSKYLFVLYFLVGVLCFIFVPPVIKLVFPNYVNSIIYFKILLLALPFYGLILINRIVYAFRWQKFLFIQLFFKIALVLVFGLILIPSMGIYGGVIEYTITEISLMLIMYFYLIRKFPVFKLSLRNFFIFDKNDINLIKILYSRFKDRLKRRFVS